MVPWREGDGLLGLGSWVVPVVHLLWRREPGASIAARSAAPTLRRACHGQWHVRSFPSIWSN
jgi:hypothetical protein